MNKMIMKDILRWKLPFYIASCLIGAFLEWAYGTFWAVIGTAPWIYSNSLHYTSLEGLPLWGLGAFVCISVYKAIFQRKARPLLGVILPTLLALFWIIVYTQFIA